MLALCEAVAVAGLVVGVVQEEEKEEAEEKKIKQLSDV